MRRVRWPLLALAVVFACGNGRRAFDPESSGFGSDGGTEAGPSEDGVRCSRDLRSVVDARDESRVIAECAPAEGCAEGKCIPACSAAVGANSSIGCEFVALPPPPFASAPGSCFAAFLTNTWGVPARVDGEYAGAPLDIAKSGRIVRTEGANVTYEPFTGEIPPGQVAVVFLSQKPSGQNSTACPEGVVTAVPSDTALHGTKRGPTLRLKTTVPVSAYSIYPFGGAASFIPSATLLLPLSSWKSDYIVTNPWSSLTVWNPTASAEVRVHPTTQIVAAEDDTEVTVVGSVHIQGSASVEGAEKGVEKTYRLQRGEQLQFEQEGELTGTRIGANKPVGVWTGHSCMFLPAECCCDSSQIELFPVQSWGREYAVVPYRSRRVDEFPEQYMFRMTGAVDGTVLTYEPKRPKDAPISLGVGASVTFATDEPFVVRSQDADHPFAIFAYMTGPMFSQATADDGDPEFTSVIPTEQYLGKYVFFVDPTYPNSQLVVVRSREEGKELQPVVLDCAGTLDGWAPLGSSGKHEYTRLRLTKGGEPQPIGTGTCTVGRHEIESAGPIAVTVWGSGRHASYAYPGGAALRTINGVETIVR